MKILVCCKQVPDTTEMKIDPVTNTLIRQGVPSILNTYDAYALEQALQLKEKDPETTVTVISMGPPQALSMLRDCLAVGADKAYLVTDRKFGGSDTLATSYILQTAIRYLSEKEGQYDLICCGKQAIDGDTAQVGPEIAEQLDIPQVTYGLHVEEQGDQKVHVTRELDDAKQIIEAQLPCLITFTKTDELRYPTVKGKLQSYKADITSITFEELGADMDEARIGLKGSPTRVKKTFTPQKSKNGLIITDRDADVAVEKLVNALHDQKLF